MTVYRYIRGWTAGFSEKCLENYELRIRDEKLIRHGHTPLQLQTLYL